ncbi:MAG TPA: FAD-binding protein, partial [Candidatus Eisenbacteria bacterium]|nr:FAD-binding protein [Candidatus Eisenbacteria bacterium]
MHEILVIGGGAAGLTAGMFGRMRKMSVVVVDAGRLGGQLVSLYGDKPVHDWPGQANVIAAGLADTLIGHARELGVELLERLKVTALAPGPDGGYTATAVHRDTREERAFEARAVIVAIGGGAFEPRHLRVPGEDGLDEDQL